MIKMNKLLDKNGYIFKIKTFIINLKKDMGIGDWGLGIGDWGLGPIPNPQSPIPNPQSPIPICNIKLIFQ